MTFPGLVATSGVGALVYTEAGTVNPPPGVPDDDDVARMQDPKGAKVLRGPGGGIRDDKRGAG